MMAPSSAPRPIMLIAAICSLAACIGSRSNEHFAPCGTGELRAGILPGSTGLRLGEPVQFDDGVGIASGRCAALFDGDTLVAWIHAYHQADSRLLVQTCGKIADDGSIASGSVSGAVSDEYVELVSTGVQPQLRALAAPMWSTFANPAFCRSQVAYWGVAAAENGPMDIHAVVYDLIGDRVVEDRNLGSMSPESDSRDFFQRPQWSADARSVFFRTREDGAAGNSIDSHRFDLPESGQ